MRTPADDETTVYKHIVSFDHAIVDGPIAPGIFQFVPPPDAVDPSILAVALRSLAEEEVGPLSKTPPGAGTSESLQRTPVEGEISMERQASQSARRRHQI